jgi:hypothetical protein
LTKHQSVILKWQVKEFSTVVGQQQKVSIVTCNYLKKDEKAKFCESVTRCLDIQDVLTIKRQQMFSRCAREYMVAYHTLDNHKDDKKNNPDEKKDGTQRNPLMTASLIKKIVIQNP